MAEVSALERLTTSCWRQSPASIFRAVEKLRCPDDGHVLLVEHGSVPFYWCRHCNGLWFSRESLDLRRHATIPAQSRVATDSDAGIVRSCPACTQPLARERNGEVVLDACRQCGGVWMDPGEYPAVLRRAALQRMKKEFPSLAPDPPGGIRRLVDTLLDILGKFYFESGPPGEAVFDFTGKKKSKRRRRTR